MKVKPTKQPSKVLQSFSVSGKADIRMKTNFVKNNKLTNSSRQWINRHINDEFTQKSKALGYRARSAFKLIEIQDKYKIIQHNSSVLDLGCSPGSWSEVLVGLTHKKVIGIDLLETEPMSGTFFIQGDFLDRDIQKQALQLNGNKKFDVIVSDISPNTTGMQTVDHLRIMYVLEIETKFVQLSLIKGGRFVSKVFQGEGLEQQIALLKTFFKKVKIFKPKASRKESKEVYLICLEYII